MEMTSIGASDADKARAGRLKTIYDQINSWEIPNFMLHLTVLTEGPGNPPLRRLRRELRDWIDGLDVDEIAALSAVSDSFFTDQSAPREVSDPGSYGFLDLVTSDDGTGIRGGVGGGPGYASHAVFYVGVPNVEAALQRAESLGGARVMGPATSPSGLVVGHFTDPEGTLIGVAGVA